MKKNIINNFLFYIIPIFLGSITSFSLPPYNFFFLNFLTLSIFFIFFVSNFKNNNLKAFLIGWLFGFGYFISSLYWIINSLTFEEIFKPLIPVALFLIPSFLALFYGLATFILALFKIDKNYSSILLFALVLSIIEFFRGIILGGFPWNLIAYSWTSYTDYLQILSFIGTYSFNLISTTLFLIPVIIILKKQLNSKLIVIIFLILLMGSNFYFGKSIKNEYSNLESIKLDTKIKIISPNIEMQRYFQNEDPILIINELIQLGKSDVEKAIFVFPEGSFPGIFLEDLYTYKKIFRENFSEKDKIVLGINSIENSNIYNSMVVLDNNLNILEKYKKNKLVPFGEFLPFEDLFSSIGLKKITQGYISFSSHNQREILNIDNLSFLPLICYEIIYSGRLKKNNHDFDFILNISEDGWFGDSIGPHQHFAHSIFRSIEEGKNLIRSTNGGISAYIDSTGRIIDKIKSTDKGVIEVNSYKKTSKTFFSTQGNKIFFYFVFFYIILFFFLKKKGS